MSDSKLLKARHGWLDIGTICSMLIDCLGLVRRCFTALDPERKWVAGITEIATQEGKLFLGVVLGLCSKLVCG